MIKYDTSQKAENERARYKVKCKKCGHTLVFTPSNKKNKILCNYCGYYIYRSKKDKFKELFQKKKREVDNAK